MKYIWSRKTRHRLVFVAVACIFGLVAPAQAQIKVAITGGVENASTWLNDPDTTPPNWHVLAETGEPTTNAGRVMVALYSSDSVDGSAISSLYLEPEDFFAVTNLAEFTDGEWRFGFPEASFGSTYSLQAWIDGNNNRSYDIGEPVGTAIGFLAASDPAFGNLITIRDDSDFDGMDDWWEVHWFGDLSEADNTDYDNDGISNLDEQNYIEGAYPTLRPNHWDSDGDGMDDGWEFANGLNATDPTGVNGATGDPDGDTLNNLFEYRGPDGRGPKEDRDGDGVPEWWVSLHNLEQYLEYYSSAIGPYHVECPETPGGILDFIYFRSFIGYASVGNSMRWVDDEDDPDAFYRTPKTRMDFDLGVYSTYSKYVYLYSQPVDCVLEIFTPGMVSTIVYVNGERVTPVGEEANTLQSLDIADAMRLGRNMIYVECESDYYNDQEALPSFFESYQEFRDCDPSLPEVPVDCDLNAYPFKNAVGKFDARLTCNGSQPVIRGDESRADPRAVWHCQYWSTGMEEYGNCDLPKPDRELRFLPGNQDYGVPANAERDNNPQDPELSDDDLDVVYEYTCGTNPRDRNTDNNGIPDGFEDFDFDGLVNGDEQRNGSSPWLADTDDDGLIDGVDAGSAGHPAESLSPAKNLSLRIGGSDRDFVEFPKQHRFALQKWTVETWIQPAPDETDGGIIIERWVTTNALNYQLGLGDGVTVSNNIPFVRFVPNFGADEVVLQGDTPIPTGVWTHVAGSYQNGEMRLFVGGTNIATRSATVTPAVFAGGPIIQRIGPSFKGLIDELRIWRTARAAADIRENRDDVLTGLESQLVGYYRFDDSTSFTNGVGFTIGASANNGTNGLPAGTAWVDGQVEDYLLKFGADWENRWLHAGSLRGNVAFSTNSAVLGPPQLQVYIEPDEAAQSGGQWSYNGGASWNDSGYLETHLAPGIYPLSFRIIDGWIEPAATNVTLERGVVTVLTNRYIETASVMVTLNNNADVLEAARWTPDGGTTWYRSGERAEGLVPGSPGIDILFNDISDTVPGYLAPASINVVLDEGEQRIVTTQYSPIIGNVRVTFSPSNIVDEARWLISGDTNWYGSGENAVGLSYGLHSITYTNIEGWSAPDPEDVFISSGDLIALDRTYERIPQPTSIRVTILPQDAIDEGARWRVDGGIYRDSDEVVLVDPGSHTISFRAIEEWYTPATRTVNVEENVQTRILADYGRLAIIGGYGTDPGRFKYPRGLAAQGSMLYITDSGNNRV